MSDNNKYDIADIINFSTDQKPVEVKAAVDALMLQKAHAAIEAKKIEVAKQMFGNAAESDETVLDDEFEDDEEETEGDESDESDDETEDDDFADLSDEELEDLLNDLEDLDDTDFDDNLEDDNSDVEDTEDGEDA